MDRAVAFVVSDLHLGSEFFFHDRFIDWLDSLPPDASLVLNGDTIDDPDEELEPAHKAVLDRLAQESKRREVIWIYGNHDADFVLENPAQVRFVHHWEMEGRLLVLHGDSLDQVMPRHRYFKRVFKFMHRILVIFGFPKVHVAQFAKKWGFLYRVLNEHVMKNALRAARDRGFGAVACGHTHSPMQVEQGGHTYFNTGAWTEEPLHYLAVGPDGIGLLAYNGDAT